MRGFNDNDCRMRYQNVCYYYVHSFDHQMIAKLVKCLTNWLPSTDMTYRKSTMQNHIVHRVPCTVYRIVPNQSDEFYRIIKLKLNNWSSNFVIDLAEGKSNFVTLWNRFGFGIGNTHTHITHIIYIKSSFNILPLMQTSKKKY